MILVTDENGSLVPRQDWEGSDPHFFMEELQPPLELLPELEHYASPIKGDGEMLVSYLYEKEVR